MIWMNVFMISYRNTHRAPDLPRAGRARRSRAVCSEASIHCHEFSHFAWQTLGDCMWSSSSTMGIAWESVECRVPAELRPRELESTCHRYFLRVHVSVRQCTTGELKVHISGCHVTWNAEEQRQVHPSAGHRSTYSASVKRSQMKAAKGAHLSSWGHSLPRISPSSLLPFLVTSKVLGQTASCSDSQKIRDHSRQQQNCGRGKLLFPKQTSMPIRGRRQQGHS